MSKKQKGINDIDDGGHGAPNYMVIGIAGFLVTMGALALTLYLTGVW